MEYFDFRVVYENGHSYYIDCSKVIRQKNQFIVLVNMAPKSALKYFYLEAELQGLDEDGNVIDSFNVTKCFKDHVRFGKLQYIFE